ncbi:MAG: Rid family detoxifying hydrolase [Parachlamydiaceae bacterium]
MTVPRSAIKRLETSEAPLALGPYSQGVMTTNGNSLVFVSGQLPMDPKTGHLIAGDIQAMTKQVIENLEAILRAGGSNLDLVVRTDVFLTDLKDFAAMNEEYARHFKGQTTPARQTVQVGALPKGASIEISCIAVRA